LDHMDPCHPLQLRRMAMSGGIPFPPPQSDVHDSLQPVDKYFQYNHSGRTSFRLISTTFRSPRIIFSFHFPQFHCMLVLLKKQGHFTWQARSCHRPSIAILALSPCTPILQQVESCRRYSERAPLNHEICPLLSNLFSKQISRHQLSTMIPI
jgi:hypothetical protein